MEYNFTEIGERIREERRKRKISQEKLIETLVDECSVPIARNRLSAIENGNEESFSLDFMLAICKIFDWDMGYLLGEYEETKIDIHAISVFTGLSERAIKRFHNMDPQYRDAIMPLLEDKALERAGGFLSLAFRSISKVDSQNHTPWIVTDNSKITINEDGTITTTTTLKEAAKQFTEDAKETLNSTIEMIVISEWNGRKNKNG